MAENTSIFAPFWQHFRSLAVKSLKNALRVLQVESEQSNDITDRDVTIFGHQRPIPGFAGVWTKKILLGKHTCVQTP
ncbi:MAG: hypothetical protein ACOVN5_11080, partial [Aquidulcibacter sp.]